MNLTLESTGKRHRVDYDSRKDRASVVHASVWESVITTCGLRVDAMTMRKPKPGDKACKMCEKISKGEQ